ncbi:MAG: transposase [Edafosvirus sp.]|uniref:Transposase n=1 Tax=Edafosvirus sp. TaxID=2487765 RepID=A0A3G4ZVG8_9VIRU|nr:MAG: transposase [Edafosvirus sp.]
MVHLKFNKKKKKKKPFNPYHHPEYKKLSTSHALFSPSLWNPHDLPLSSVANDTDSWFDFVEYTDNFSVPIQDFSLFKNNSHDLYKHFFRNKFKNIHTRNKNYKTIIIPLSLTFFQQKIMLHWMYCCILMYNATVECIRKIKFNTGEYMYAFRTLRDKHLKHIKKYITSISRVEVDGIIYYIHAHTLNMTIKEVCNAYKGCMETYKYYILDKNGKYIKKIKPFRIKYRNFNNPLKYIAFEARTIAPDKMSFFASVFGPIIERRDGLDFRDIKREFLIQYNTKTNEFTMLSPQIIPPQKKENNEPMKYISLDAGLNVFLTGITNDKVVELGSNLIKVIMELLKKIDKIEKDNKPNKKRRKRRLEKKIKNLIEDMHWKIINYLVKNYKIIFLGELKIKNIISNTKELPEILKRITTTMSFYKFRERLKYKCKVNNVELHMVNEMYTSKTCGKCCKINEVEGRKYECKHIEGIKIKKYVVGRDINGAYCILLKGIYDTQISCIMGEKIK